jgi:uncharacterized protein YxeA
MKKILKISCKLMLTIILFSSCSSSKSELYEKTDSFVESKESYGLYDMKENSKTTKDGHYTITPLGKLIIVKINKLVSSEEYENLKESLLSHYKGNKKVKNVFISSGGAIMIDCRN